MRTQALICMRVCPHACVPDLYACVPSYYSIYMRVCPYTTLFLCVCALILLSIYACVPSYNAGACADFLTEKKEKKSARKKKKSARALIARFLAPYTAVASHPILRVPHTLYGGCLTPYTPTLYSLYTYRYVYIRVL